MLNKIDTDTVGTRVACQPSMRRDLTFLVGILVGVLFLGSLGAFLLYVPILPLTVVVTTLLGLILMFVLGIQTGGRRIRISRVRKASRSLAAQWNSLNRVR